jgi:RNA polymerase sigma-70 factor (ECF subfamily)
MLVVVGGGDGVAGAASEPVDFDTLFRREYPAITRTTYLIVHEWGVAEEIAQEAFLQLFRKWPRVSRYDRPGAWVRRVALRMAVKAARREQRRDSVERAALEPPAGQAAGVDDDILQAVGRLPGAQRAAVVLFYFEDRPVVEVAHLLGCSPATAKVHLHRARMKLADLLGEELDDVS